MSRHRGRKSAAELAVVPISAVQRPDPPPEFSPEEREVWELTVRGMRADWFSPETHPLLRAYCVEAAMAEHWERALRATGGPGDRKFGQLAGLHRSATKTMAMLATRLRLTPRSNRASSRDGRDPTGGFPRPWEPAE